MKPALTIFCTALLVAVTSLAMGDYESNIKMLRSEQSQARISAIQALSGG